MNIQTSSGNVYSYLRRTNEIVSGIVEENDFVWKFEPLQEFSALPNVDNIIISITEQCNLRCTYCCYSGKYKGNRVHSSLSLCESDVDAIFDFVEANTNNRPLRFSFYGGEPLMHYSLLQYAVLKAESKWEDKVSFSITTNATLLTPERIDWLVAHQVELCISIDGTSTFNDNQRVDINGHETFARVREHILYIKEHHSRYLDHTRLMMTRQSFDDLEALAEAWDNDDVLRNISPSYISSLAPNPIEGVATAEFNILKTRHLQILTAYQEHPDWVILKEYLKECIEPWKNRPIMEAEGEIPMATCLPVSNKLFIDAKLQIGVCEKISDSYRLGNIKDGIDWQKSNDLVQTYYDRRKDRCKSCPAIRMCNLCLTSMEFDKEQWNVLCHNEQTYNCLYFWLFCEMAERGMIDNEEFPTLQVKDFVFDKITEKDVQPMMEILADKETKRFMPELNEAIREEDDVRFFLNNINIAQPSGEAFLGGIRHDSDLVGFIGIIGIPDYPSLFYAMHPHHRGKGIMTECVATVIEWFRNNYLFLPLHTEVYKDNAPSIQLLLRNEFTQFNEDDQKNFLMLEPITE